MRISPISTLDPNYLAPGWSSILLIAMPEGAFYVHLSHQDWSQRSKCCGRVTPVNVACAEHTQMCTVGRKNSGLSI